MRTSLLFTTLMGLVIISVSCKKHGDPVAPDGNTALEGNLEFRLSEYTNSENRGLVFNWQTERTYECSNAFPSFFSFDAETKIYHSINSLGRTESCNYTPGKAKSKTIFNNMRNGQYMLQFVVKGQETLGQIVITDSTYAVTMNSTTPVKSLTTVLRRKPLNTIYGSLHTYSLSDSIIARAFMDSLRVLGAQSGLLIPGDYGDFSLESNQQVIPYTPSTRPYSFYYMLTYNGNPSALLSLVRQFEDRYQNAISLTLMTARGDRFTGGRP